MTVRAEVIYECGKFKKKYKEFSAEFKNYI
jgi:hypothetical protein